MSHLNPELSLFKWSTNNQLLNTFLVVFLLIVSGSHYSLGLKSSSTNSFGSNNNNNKSVNSHVKCSMAEFTCANGRCITLNKFCNNLNDCGDSSDEPRFCTRCNRTYYGNTGVTYDLELHRPKEDKIPYICVLTFTAAGGVHGDIVQITIESFTLGKFVSYTQDGCPDGYLQMSEATRTPIGGMWCGQSWGPAIFYSETRSLVLTVKLFKLSKNQSGYNFDFRIQYKVLPRDKAVVRFGGIKHQAITPWTTLNYIPNYPSIDDTFNTTTAYSEQYSYDTHGINTIYTKDRIQFKNTSLTLSENLPINYTEPKYYLGDLIPGTYCSRIFSDCDKKACRLQSPNFPGVYPRNLTCYYAVRQHEVPPGKHAIIIVSQPKGNLVWVATDAISAMAKTEKEKQTTRIRIWDECDQVQDYVTIYDGYTTRDPIILKFCGGGQAVPASTSSGPELLVEFTTSPYGTFLTSQQRNINTLYGFQLEVQVKFVDIQSPTYAKSKRLCEFWLRGTGHGVLENPEHSLAPNTTCLYHMQGTEATIRSNDPLQIPRRSGSLSPTPTRFKIWISVLKFEMSPKFGYNDESQPLMQPVEDCSGMLRIWDGPLRDVPVCNNLDCLATDDHSPMRYGHNQTNVIARYCRGSIPRSCDHGILNNSNVRSCSLAESYISSSDFVTLELKTTESTVLRPLAFKLRYEFVDFLQDGQPVGNDIDCIRKFTSSLVDKREPIMFRSNRNVFLFGRGGAVNLTCVYRFEAQRGERVRITINRMMSGNRTCTSKVDPDIDRSFCYGNSDAKVTIFERPWHESIIFPRGCICNSTKKSHLPIIYTSTGREVEVHLTAVNMTSLDDPDSLNFEGTFEFIKGPMHCKDIRRKTGASGVVSLTMGDMECRNRPWLIEPTPGKSLYVRLRGFYMRRYNPNVHIPLNSTLKQHQSYCHTRSRVVITTGEGVIVTVCPMDQDSSNRHIVEVFSAGWNQKNIFDGPELSKVVSVEYLNPDEGDFALTWLELTKKPIVSAYTEECPYQCPELNACINASVWCDGKSHCPSGHDESFTHCSALLRLPAEILATLCVFFLVMCCGLVAFLYRKIKRKFRRSSVLQTRLKSLSSMDTAVFDEKEVIC